MVARIANGVRRGAASEAAVDVSRYRRLWYLVVTFYEDGMSCEGGTIGPFATKLAAPQFEQESPRPSSR